MYRTLVKKSRLAHTSRYAHATLGQADWKGYPTVKPKWDMGQMTMHCTHSDSRRGSADTAGGLRVDTQASASPLTQ